MTGKHYPTMGGKNNPAIDILENNSEQIDWLITSTANPLPLIAKTRLTIIPQT